MKRFLWLSGALLLSIGFFLFFQSYESDFTTLDTAVAYAQKMQEYPAIDNKDWYKPDYHSFFSKKEPSFLKSFLYKLGISKPYWSLPSFRKLITTITNNRIKEGYLNGFVQKFVLSPDKKLIIWGNAQGAFHSLVRDLQELQKKGIITNQLQITSPDYYFIFTGNAIGRSAYSIETLTLILQLMKVNPGQVIYVRGTHESNQYWHNFDLAHDLKTRFWYLTKRGVPLTGLFDRFFETLPLALYLINEADNQIVRITNRTEPAKLKEKNFGEFFQPSYTASHGKLGKLNPSENIEIAVNIASNLDKQGHYVTEGLRLLMTSKGTPLWGLLSAPTSSYKERFNFENDAFVIIKTAQQFADWTITLCKQNAKKQEGFVCAEPLRLLTGMPLGADVPTQVFTVGSLMDLSMGLEAFNSPLMEGIQACFYEQNQMGGIQGKRIRLAVKDDKYTPTLTRLKAEEFLKEGIDTLIIPVGTDPLSSYIELVKEKKLLVLFPITAQRYNLPFIIYFRPSFFEGGKMVTKHAIDDLNARRLAFFFPRDEFGITMMKGARETLVERDIQDYLEVPFKRTSLKFDDQIKKIRAFNPDTLFIFTISSSAQEFIRQMGVDNLSAVKLVGNSDLAIISFQNFLSKVGLNMTIPSVVPNPAVSQIPLVKQYREVMEKYKVNVTTSSLEGYIVARILIEALKRIKGTITQQKLISVLQKFKKFNFEGFPLNFKENDRELSHSLWIPTLPKERDMEWQLKELNH